MALRVQLVEMSLHDDLKINNQSDEKADFFIKTGERFGGLKPAGVERGVRHK